MNGASTQDAVVQLLVAQQRRGMLGRKHHHIELPPPQPTELLLLHRHNGQAEMLERLDRSGLDPKGLAPDAAIIRLLPGPRPLALSFSAITRDVEGFPWDLTFCGSWAIREPRQFLLEYALRAVTPEAALTPALAESWLIGRLRGRVGDELRGKELAYLRDREGLPAAWWEKRLGEWLAGCGLEVKVTGLRWNSADAELALAERKRLEELKTLEESSRQQHAAELRRMVAKSSFEREKARLETDIGLSQAESAHRRQVAEMQYHREILEAQSQLEQAQRSAEQAALEHEVSMARLRRDLEGQRLAAERQRSSEQRREAMSQRLATARQTMERLDAVPPSLFDGLRGCDGAEAFQAAERLVSPEFGLPADSLALLGFSVGRQLLVQILGRSDRNDAAVALAKHDLRTRDIGAARVKALPIGSSLQFNLTSRRDGFVTVLNIGTSGAVYLHVPSALAVPAAARVGAGQSYSIPGAKLFPWDGDYREEGPPGWEHIAAIVSDQTLMDPAILARSSPECPIVQLSEEEVEFIADQLSDAPPGSWSAGVLSFLVG